MPAHIALLRAVNVAGHQMVGMADLRELLAGLGYENPRSLLQSGNLIFDAPRGTPRTIEARLEDAAKRRLGLDTDFFVRTAAEWRAIVAGNPFPREAERDPARLLLLCLKAAADRRRVAALQQAIVGREVLRGGGRHAYVVYPDGVGRSKLTGALIEKHLGTRATGRNWNTVLKLAALSGA